jgi:hypothetical protein
VYRDSPDVFERAARFALQSTAYELEVVMLFAEAGARLMQTDRLHSLLRIDGVGDLVDELITARVYFELDIGAARRAGVVETLGAQLPNLRIADQKRIAELVSNARMTVRF